MTARIISAPTPEVVEMLERRMRPESRDYLRRHRYDAVGLVQTSVTDLFFFADVASKSSNVHTVELYGSCPQHVSTLAFFGETSAVHAAMEAIQREMSAF